MFIISSLAYIPAVHIHKFIILFESLMPESVYSIISSIIDSAIENRNINNVIISFGLSLWSSSKAVTSIIKAMNTYHDVDETRSPIKILSICFLFTSVLFVLIFSSLVLLIYGEVLGAFVFDFLGLDEMFLIIWNYFRYCITIFTVIIAFLILFKYTPNKKLPLSECLPGAITSTLSWILISIGYSYYANNFASYEVIYGSLSSVITLITWLYLSSFAILFGCEVNARLKFKRLHSNKSFSS